MKLMTGTLVALLLSTPAFAQDPLTIGVGESETLGQYLTGDAGRAVYRLATDPDATDDTAARPSCTSDACLAVWPRVTADASGNAVTAGEGVDADLLLTLEGDAAPGLTYNGWALHYFAGDAGADAPQGQKIVSFGGAWDLVAPDAAAAPQDAAGTGSDTAQEVAGDAGAGGTMYARNCAQCHGRNGAGTASFPALTGKDAGFVTGRLEQYRAGERVGPNSGLMFGVARGLSDEDIADLSAFISTGLN